MNSPVALLAPQETPTPVHTDPIWETLLQLRTELHRIVATDALPEPEHIEYIAFQPFTPGELCLRINPTASELMAGDVCVYLVPFCQASGVPGIATVFELPGTGWARLLHLTRAFSEEQLQLFTLYLPYCFAAIFAARRQRCFAVSHFAQSLDGQIATGSGDSRWIGNQANLVHAHRMRALCDAVLVGRGTLEADAPQLNVRHVSGPNPQRVFLGNCAVSAPDWNFRLTGDKEQDLHCTSTASPTHLSDCNALLVELHRRGINSVYVEGGARTTSLFLQQNALDLVQLHIAPMLVGPGRSAFALPGVERIRDAACFERHRYVPIGDEVMFLGERAASHANANENGA